MNLGFEREQTPQEVLEWRVRLARQVSLNAMSAELSKGILDADIVLWADSMWWTAQSVGVRPNSFADCGLRTPLELWVWNRPTGYGHPRSDLFLDGDGKGNHKPWGLIATLAVQSDLDDIRFADIYTNADSVEVYPSVVIASGKVQGDGLGMLYETFAHFLNLKVAVKERPSFNRAARRQLERQNIDHSKIQIITLRKGEPHKPKGTRQVEWSCQWDVRPFYGIRHTKEGPKRVLISGHRKGPEGKPLKERGEMVSIVKR